MAISSYSSKLRRVLFNRYCPQLGHTGHNKTESCFLGPLLPVMNCPLCNMRRKARLQRFRWHSGIDDRKKLFEGLENLTGLLEGPRNALPDGTRYEYDPILKRTVEITPSGARFPVTLVDGNLQRDSHKANARKGEVA